MVQLSQNQATTVIGNVAAIFPINCVQATITNQDGEDRLVDHDGVAPPWGSSDADAGPRLPGPLGVIGRAHEYPS
jgi:hypothetical protein